MQCLSPKTRVGLALLCVLLLAGSSIALAQTTITRTRQHQHYGLGTLECADYSPDGKYILTGGGSSNVFLWDIETGIPVRALVGCTGYVHDVVFSPDGTKVLTGMGWAADNVARLWNLADGRLIRSYSGHSDVITSVDFSPDGTRFVTGSCDHTARIWNTAEGTVHSVLSGLHTDWVWSVDYSPDGQRILTAGRDGMAWLWNAETGAVIRGFYGHTDVIEAITFSPDGRIALTGSYDRTAILWEVATGNLIYSFAHSAEVVEVAFSPDGTMLATGDRLGVCRVWRLADYSLICTIPAHTAVLVGLRFSADNTRILTASRDGTAKIWNISDGGLVQTFSGHKDFLSAVAVSPDGSKVLTGSMGNCAYLWNAADGSLLWTFSGHTDEVNSVAFSRDGKRILTCDQEGVAIVWDVASRDEIVRFNWVASFMYGMFSADGSQVLLATEDGKATVWNADGSLAQVLSGHTAAVYSAVFSPDDKLIVTASRDGTVRIWDAETSGLVETLTGHVGFPSYAEFSPDGRKILTASRTDLGPPLGEAKLWDWNGTRASLIRTFDEGNQGVHKARFSPDGTKILTVDGGAKQRLWDANSGRLICVFSGHSLPTWDGTFTPDGKQVITCSYDGTARLWEIWPAKAIIVAGGGHFANNAIAEQTQQLAAYAYRICTIRGYGEDEIQYLSAFGEQDADGDSVNDVDVPAATVADLRDALVRFSSDTARLFIYMVDHGYHVGDGMYFQMNPTELLSATELDAWLDDLQSGPTSLTRPAGPNCHVTLIVDSCYSGNFLSACTPPATDTRRLVIASTTSDSIAIFLPPPALTSFSYQFLGALYMGYKVSEAFESARAFFGRLGVVSQMPWMDADGDGVYTAGVDDSSTGPAADEFFGTSWAYAAGGGWEPPAFTSWTLDQTVALGSTATIWVRMEWNERPERVVATILPPRAELIAGQALTDLPRVELVRDGRTGFQPVGLHRQETSATGQLWSAPFSGFTEYGTYVVAHVAHFEGARLTKPVYSHISVGAPANPPALKAILVSGGILGSDMADQTAALANLAYRVSDHRGFERDEIRYLSALGWRDADGDGMNDVHGNATSANVAEALWSWAAVDCERLLVYLVGPGENAGEAVFRLNWTEQLRAADLDAPLDALQTLGGVEDVIVVADFPYAAEFLQSCAPPDGKRRVLIAGTNSDKAIFLPEPQCTSFSFVFLSAAHMGHNLLEAYRAALNFFRLSPSLQQTPWLDDIVDGSLLGENASKLHWGYPWAFAGPEGGELPFILQAGPWARVEPGRDVTLWVDLMEGPTPQRVMATIIPPSVDYIPGQPITDFPTLDLTREGETWRWSALASGFTEAGRYTLLFQALYTNERLSDPLLVPVFVPTTVRDWQSYR